ncbi:MAG: glycoside hydrolase family 3 N-terminal domain-containing protein [Acidobacteriota bacterium]
MQALIPENHLPIWVTIDEAEPGPSLVSFLKEIRPYGVLLFSRHLVSPAQVASLNRTIHETDPDIRIALDQEGGRVNRLASLGFEFESAEDTAGDEGRAAKLAHTMGKVLRDLGFDVDFAPVADLGPALPGTGLETRLFGREAGIVTRCCRAFLHALKEEQIEGCLKHFPGLGGSRVDSHHSLPAVEGSTRERTRHLAPYRALAGEAPYVMTAHLKCPGMAIDRPASLHPATYRMLAGLGFEGLSVTDDLSMGAAAGEGTLAGRAAQGLRSGADLALWVSSQRESLAVAQALRESGLP